MYIVLVKVQEFKRDKLLNEAGNFFNIIFGCIYVQRSVITRLYEAFRQISAIAAYLKYLLHFVVVHREPGSGGE